MDGMEWTNGASRRHCWPIRAGRELTAIWGCFIAMMQETHEIHSQARVVLV